MGLRFNLYVVASALAAYFVVNYACESYMAQMFLAMNTCTTSLHPAWSLATQMLLVSGSTPL